jgi:hypothetical protein
MTQNIRGQVVDRITRQPLPGVQVVVLNAPSATGTQTDAQGRFEFRALPLGRYRLQFTTLGYQPVLLNDVPLNSGKEVILNIDMDERVLSTKKEMVVKARRDKDKPLNEMAMVSARMFSVDETARYAGTVNDPARMAQNFAGVQANGDTRNDIVIRGNSPLGVLWRLEGIDIPNPNHFSGVGTTGGGISMVNNNNLSNCDFLTGAFPAQYGNATAGVFDLKLRNGNDERREYTVMFGMNGLEAGAEGPLSRKNHGSYVANYRYSTLDLFDALGINLGTASIPKYQDGVFKIHLPTAKAGVFDVFGLGGYSTSSFLSKSYDTTGAKLNPLPKGFNTDFDNHMIVAGAEHAYSFGQRTLGKAVLTFSSNGNRTRVDSLYNNESEVFPWLRRTYVENKLSVQYTLSHRFNTRHNTQAGVYYAHTFFTMKDSIWVGWLNGYRRRLDMNGGAGLGRVFVQHQYRPGERVSLVLGVNGMLFMLNGSAAIEPRLGMKVQVRRNVWLSAGAGMHNQLQPMVTYFYQTRQPSGRDSATNSELGFSRSAHAVLGADWLPRPDLRVKAETYYQHLDRLPVDRTPSSYSMVNDGAFYVITNRPFLQNSGRGYNLGAELTIEKFFTKNYYFLLTGSLYQSLYRGSDRIERHTAFDGTYAANVLLGYDLKLGKKSLLSLNVKATFLGGRRYTPVDTAASLIAKEMVYIDALAYTERHPAYFRPDIKIAYRLNWKGVSQEFAVNINNFIDRDNIQNLEYDRDRNRIGYSYQLGLIPVIQYRIDF